jgi:uncharacterized protein
MIARSDRGLRLAHGASAAWLTAWKTFAAVALTLLTLLAPRIAGAYTPPRLDGHVVDAAGKLSPEQRLRIDEKLDRLRRTSGFAIVVFLPASLEGQTIEDVAYDTFNAWGVGAKDRDDGVLLVVATAERRVRIETGKGVGGELTDLQSSEIIRGMAPLLRAERYYEAVDGATDAIARALAGEGAGATAQGKDARRPIPNGGGEALGPGDPLRALGLAAILVLVIVLAIVSPTFRTFLFYMILFGGRGGGRGGGGFGGSGYGGGGGRSGGGGASGGY